MKYWLTFFLLLPPSAYAELELGPVERAVTQSVDKNLSQALVLLETSVNMNSGTMNFAGVKEVGALFSGELLSLGFDVDWIDGTAFNRAGHLVANHGGSGPKILLIGHLDTVFEPSSSFQTFERIDERYASGPGATDMKGGDVVMLLAIKALREADVLEEVQLRVIMTGDEESRGTPHSLANRALIDAAKWADYALGFEDGDGDPKTAVTARRGAIGWQLKVAAKAAHSSQIFREDIGFGAIFEASRILDRFRRDLADLPKLTFNPGVIVGGTDISYDDFQSTGIAMGKDNVIAQSVIVSGDVRALSPAQLAATQATMKDIVADNLAHTEAHIEFHPGYPPMAATAGNNALLSRYQKVSELLGFGPVAAVDPRRAGAADVSFVAEHVRGAIDGLGLMGSGGHTVAETADLHTLPKQAKKAALLIYSLVRPDLQSVDGNGDMLSTN